MNLDEVPIQVVVSGWIFGRLRIPGMPQLCTELGGINGVAHRESVWCGIESESVAERALAESRLHGPPELNGPPGRGNDRGRKAQREYDDPGPGCPTAEETRIERA